MVTVKFDWIDSEFLSKEFSDKWIEVPMTEAELCKSALREWIDMVYGIRVHDLDYTYRVD